MNRSMTIRRSTRSGFTLAELFVSMVVGSTLMVLAIGVLQKSFRWSTTSRQRAAVEQSFDRLQRQFRTDVHLATKVDVDQNTLTLQSEDETTTYKVETDTVTRVQQSEENVTQRDQYRFHEMTRAEFSQVEQPGRVILRTYKRSPIKDSSGVPIWRDIQAVIGFSLRHLQEEKQ